MIVSATQIRVSGVVGLFHFLVSIRQVNRQLRSADGLIFVRTRGFRTLTGWASREALLVFRNHGAHAAAMKQTRRIGHARSITWETDREPDWVEAAERLKPIAWAV